MNILIRGGGDLGSGIAFRLHRVGWNIVITEIEKPLVLRRTVAFANAIFEGDVEIEGIQASHIKELGEISGLLSKKIIPVLISPDVYEFNEFTPDVVIDARMLKKKVYYEIQKNHMIIGLGPGFIAGENCHAAIETNRGHYMGRVIWDGEPLSDTAIPGTVSQKSFERVLRAPISGTIQSNARLGMIFKKGDEIGNVNGSPIIAPFDGCLRGLMHNGIFVEQGIKIGDLDPRLDKELIFYISEKALAIAGGVLEAILSYQIRPK